MKFISIGEDVQEYIRAIPDAMLTDDIKQSETYQMFIKYFTGLIPLKKTRGNCHKARRQLSLQSLQVLKSLMNLTLNLLENELVDLTESNPEPARRRPSGIAFRDTSSVSKNISLDPSQKLKGVQTLTAKEQLAADTMQALKASRLSNRSQPHARGSSERTGIIPGVPDESTVIIVTSSEGTGTKPGVLDKEKVTSEAKANLYSDEDKEKKDNYDDDKSIDIEEADDEQTDDEFVRDYVDKEMKDAKVAESRNDDEEITDTTKADAEKTKEVKDDDKKA
ncbi:hypothetical protein Tco_0028589 [Tanacetum coccineum]